MQNWSIFKWKFETNVKKIFGEESYACGEIS